MRKRYTRPTSATAHSQGEVRDVSVPIVADLTARNGICHRRWPIGPFVESYNVRRPSSPYSELTVPKTRTTVRKRSRRARETLICLVRLDGSGQ